MPKTTSKKPTNTESNLKELNAKLLARLRAAEAQVAVESAARVALEKTLEEEKASRCAVEDALATELAAREEAERTANEARKEALEASTKVEKALAAVRVTAVPELSYSSVDTHSTIKRVQEESPRSEASVSAGVDPIDLQGKGIWRRFVEFCTMIVERIVRRVQKLLGIERETQPLLTNVV